MATSAGVVYDGEVDHVDGSDQIGNEIALDNGLDGRDSNELLSAETAEEYPTSERFVSQDQKVGRSDFKLRKLLGKGGFGKVFQVRKLNGKDEGKIYAMKVMEKAHILKSQETTAHAKSERSVLESVNHPFIVDLMYAFQTKCKLYFVMEYLRGGDFFTRLKNKKCFWEDEARFYLSEIVMALEHLHIQGIIYRDLKPENILLDSLGHIKLTDFGACKELEEGAVTYTICGTIQYMAPEIIEKDGHGKAVDWWSLGVLAFYMLAGHLPFTTPNRNETSNSILHGNFYFPDHLTNDAKDLISKLLVRQPNQRLGYGGQDAIAIRNHAFFNTCNWDDVKGRLVVPPWKPPFASDDDVSLFDKTFTRQPPVDTPDHTLFSESANMVFRDFDYVAPSML